MKKTQSDLLNNLDQLAFNNQHFQNTPKTPQQVFLQTNLALHLIQQHSPTINHLIQPKNGSFSQLQLTLKYMRKCIQSKQNLDNPLFNVLNTLVYWVQQLKKIQKLKQLKLFNSILLPYPNKLIIEQYEELIAYFNYIAADILSHLIQSKVELFVDDLLQVLEILLPRVYYNIVNSNASEKEGEQADTLYFNCNLEYFTRISSQYKGLCKYLLKKLITMQLKPSQMRQLLEKTSRYYLLFFKDKKQSSASIYIAAFNKATQASKFSMSDQLLLFFKIIRKMGDELLQKSLRQKNVWLNELLQRFGPNSVIGHPKDEVQPFNVLSIRQNIKVEAGKTAQRIIQIYQENSLFYFLFDVESHDISMKLYYLGQFESKFEVKKLLLTKEKVSQQTKSAFLATKKGIYMLEFDNTYSWLNQKNVSFQYIILSQYKNFQNYTWLSHLLSLNTPITQEKNQQPPIQTKKAQSQSQPQQKNNRQDTISAFYQEQLEYKHKYDKYVQEKLGVNKQKIEIKKEQQRKQVIKTQNKEVKVEEKKLQIKKQQKKLQIKEEIKEKKEVKIVDKQQANDKRQVKVEKKQIKNIEKKEQRKNAQKKEQKKEILINKNIEKQQKKQPVSTKNNEKPIQKTQKDKQVKLPLNPQIPKQEYGQANLSLIDGIFSLLVNIKDHTYEFETNLQDRIEKRLKSYCEAGENLQWIFNSQARDWLKRHHFKAQLKAGLTILHYEPIHP